MEVARGSRAGIPLLLALVAPSVLVAPDTAWAQAPAESQPSEEDVRAARTRYNRAIRLYRQRAYESALAEFQKAYELAPSFRIHYNIAQVHQELGDHAAAMRSLHAYLRDGGDELNVQKRERAQEQIASLRSKVAQLVIEVNVEGAEVAVDDEVVGHAPVAEKVWVNRGPRKVRATYPGWIPAGEVVMASGGDTVQVELTLVDPGARQPAESTGGAATEQPGKPPQQNETPRGTATWVGWVATGTLAAGALTSGVLHLTAKSDLQDQRDSLGNDPQAKRDAIDDAHARATKYAIATDIFAISAAVAGSITLYVTLQNPDDKGVSVGVGPGSMQLRGSF